MLESYNGFRLLTVQAIITPCLTQMMAEEMVQADSTVPFIIDLSEVHCITNLPEVLRAIEQNTQRNTSPKHIVFVARTGYQRSGARMFSLVIDSRHMVEIAKSYEDAVYLCLGIASDLGPTVECPGWKTTCN